MDSYKLGNLTQCGFEEVQSKWQKIQFVEESKAIDPACQKCPYYGTCWEGCKRYREPRENGQLRLNYFCESYQMCFSYADSRLYSLSEIYSKKCNDAFKKRKQKIEYLFPLFNVFPFIF
jgi:uncharacterized protein